MKLQIPARSKSCMTNHPFGDQETVVSQLIKREDGSWQREDFCEKCFAAKDRAEPVYCSWHSQVIQKKPEATPLLEMFRSMQEGDPKELFFLAEVLLRQKQLLRRSRSKSELVVEDAVTGDVYWLKRFDLTLGEVRHFSMKYTQTY